jgi:hypothetical protein
MPVFLDTTSQPTLGIAICSRCQTKRVLADLVEDGNLPKFMVCRPHISPGCWDHFDPMRLPAPKPDKMTLPFVRPDVDISISDAEQRALGLPIEPPIQED